MADISICIITKNECEKLEKCLKAARSLDAEIVVVDTGSSDGTVAMAKKYTDSVYFFEWVDDFAKAKNYAASMAKNDVIIAFDSDEYLDSELSQEALNRITSSYDKLGRIRLINKVQQGDIINSSVEYLNRIFNRRHFCFSGRIHEQLVRGNVFDGPANIQEPYETYFSEITVQHDGYVGTKEQIKAKTERNLKLLLKELDSSPDDVYIMYQIGKSYFMAEENEKAAEYFGKALGYEVDPSLEYVIDMVETYGYALINSGQAQTAVLLESVADEFGKYSDFCFMLGLAFMNVAEFDRAIGYFEKAVKNGNARMTGVDSYLAYYNAGVICECSGQLERARTYYKKCGDYQLAIERLDNILL